MIKGLVIFGAGFYTGVYVAQNYQDGVAAVCDATRSQCDRALGDRNKKKWFVHISIDKVENPKVLFEKAQAFVAEKLDDAKKDDGKSK